MTGELTDTVALWLLLPSMAVVVLVVVSQAIEPSDGTRKRKRSEQVTRLYEVCRSASGTLELDWLRYKEVPRAELLKRLQDEGWHHAGEKIEPRSWTLRFTRDAAEAERARHRSAAVPATASRPDGARGWQGPGDPDPPGVPGHAPEREQYWARQFRRQVGFAAGYGIVGVAAFVGAFVSAEGGRLWLLLTVSLVLLALSAITSLKAMLIRRRRRTEAGDSHRI